MNPQKKVQIALIGCGRISFKHLHAIFDNRSDCNLVALCDTSVEKLDQALLKWQEVFASSANTSKPLLFSSYDDLLQAYKNSSLHIDLVVLCTPSGIHSSQAIQAAISGINVCTEKPMSTRWDDGLAMIKEFDKYQRKLFVVKQNRFNSTLQFVKKHMLNNSFGRLYMITSNVFWQRPQQYYDQDEWRGTWEFDGGALMNQASHYVDLLEWIGGPVESVSASTATLARNIEVEDTAALQLKWRNGALGTMAVTMLTYPKNLEGSLTILGEYGSVKIGGTSLNKIEHWSVKNHEITNDELQDINFQPQTVYGNGHTPYYRDMLSSLIEGVPSMCDGRQGLKSLELLIASYLSARDGTTIHLPLSY